MPQPSLQSRLFRKEFFIPFSVATLFFVFVTAYVFCEILSLNDGLLVYALDDPYIHLAMAENILRGHYGVNLNEYSAASSSIIWPFLLAPGSFTIYSPFALNFLCSLVSIFAFTQIFTRAFQIQNLKTKMIFVASLSTVFVLTTNLISLLFSGMENSLQIAVILAIALGLVIEHQENRLPKWFLAALFFAPLVRYENMAVCLPVGLYLFCNGYKKQTLVLFTLIGLTLGAFSLFLWNLGLEILPTSILAKTTLMTPAEYHDTYLDKLDRNFSHPAAQLLLLNFFFFLGFLLFKKSQKGFTQKKQLAYIVLAATATHLLFGRFSPKQRYESYILALSFVMLIYFLAPAISRLFEEKTSRFFLFKLILFTFGLLILLSSNMIRFILTTPLACNNIYQQQYQMHRFATQYYKQPVAINDLGYVSYKNPNYVLDFAGLANLQALEHRLENTDPKWMFRLAKEHDVGLVMIYSSWFPRLPSRWQKIGVLHLGSVKASTYSSRVHFYATRPRAYPKIVSKLQQFIKTLPGDSKFIFQDQNLN